MFQGHFSAFLPSLFKFANWILSPQTRTNPGKSVRSPCSKAIFLLSPGFLASLFNVANWSLSPQPPSRAEVTALSETKTAPPILPAPGLQFPRRCASRSRREDRLVSFGPVPWLNRVTVTAPHVMLANDFNRSSLTLRPARDRVVVRVGFVSQRLITALQSARTRPVRRLLGFVSP